MNSVDLGELYYLESFRDYATLYTVQGKVLTLQSLRSFEELLPRGRSVRIHKSYLVGLEWVERVVHNHVRLKGVDLPIGGTYRGAFLKRRGM